MRCKVCEDGRLASFADDMFEDSFECKGCGKMYGQSVPQRNKTYYKLLSKRARHNISIEEGKVRARGF